MSLATTERLERMFDEDLWVSERPDEEERFDAERFVLWLTVLLEAGEEVAAQKVAEMDADLVALALSKQVLVLELASLERALADEDDGALADTALESSLTQELARCSAAKISRSDRCARDTPSSSSRALPRSRGDLRS